MTDIQEYNDENKHITVAWISLKNSFDRLFSHQILVVCAFFLSITHHFLYSFSCSHADVLSAVETRISLLGMTIMRYVDEGYCSFFPGKVLDELRRVYVTIKSSPEPISRSAELLRELRDISSMAMEHFDEVLLPQIYENKCEFNWASPFMRVVLWI